MHGNPNDTKLTVPEVLVRRAEVVRLHLTILEAQLQEQPSLSQAIRTSMSLRFLLDGALNRVAHELGVKISIPAPDLSNVPINETLAFACGGYTLGGTEFRPYYAYRKPGLNSPYRPQFDRQVRESPPIHSLVDVKLGKFVQLPCLAILGNIFTREGVVRYVANKCGGAHHHDDTGDFDTIEHAITDVGHILELPDQGLSLVFLETVGTAWFLLNSPDVAELRAALDS